MLILNLNYTCIILNLNNPYSRGSVDKSTVNVGSVVNSKFVETLDFKKETKGSRLIPLPKVSRITDSVPKVLVIGPEAYQSQVDHT